MSQNLYTLSLDSVKYICSLINKTVDLPATILDDLHIQSTTTYSSYKLDTLLKALKDENIAYCDAAIAGLNKLSKEIITDKSQITNENTIYLLLKDPVNNVYEQWLLINGTPQMIGTTEMKLDTVYTKEEADNRYTLITDFNTLVDKVSAIEDEIGTETLTTTSTTIKGAINEISDKSVIITLTKSEYEALAPKDPETYYITSDDMTMYKGESQVLGGKPLVGKETVLYEGSISAAGTYTLTDDVNNYDFIIINHRQASGVNCQSTTLSKYEISKCSDSEHKFMCVLGYGSSEDCTSGYFNNDKVIITARANETITSITGYKFGQVTVQNTITNPSPAASYSTDEQLTGGTWIDGKPIYRKTFYSASGWGSDTISGVIVGNIPDLKLVVFSFVTGINESDNYWSVPFSQSSYTKVYVKRTTGDVHVMNSPDHANREQLIVVEYTKTTD